MKLFKKALCCSLSFVLFVGVFSSCKKAEQTGTDHEVVEIKIFSDSAANETGDPAWLAHVEEKMGIKLAVEAPPATSYVERLQIMLASGDYPDLVCFKTNGTEFLDAVNSGVLVPINEYLEGKESLKKYTYEQSWDAMKAKLDDNIYGIPRSTMMRQDGFFIRADWLRNLGMKVPENRTLSLSEFREILERFTYDDPDGNGKNDTYGIASYNDATKGMTITVDETFRLFGWQKAEGEYEYMDPKYSKTDDRYKKALEFNAKLFTDKLIDPDAPTITTYVNSTERFKRGITGVIRAFPAYIDGYIEEMRKINPDADVCMVTSITDDEGSSKVGTPYGTGFFGLWGVTVASKHPDKVVELLDWLLSDDEWETTVNGMEGVCYNMENGERKYVPDVSQGIGRGIVRRSTDTDFHLSNVTTKYVDLDTVRTALNECMDNAIYGLDRGYTPDIASEPLFIDRQTDLVKTVTKILLGEEPVSSYDAALETWYANGGEEYVKGMNEYIKKMEAK